MITYPRSLVCVILLRVIEDKPDILAKLHWCVIAITGKVFFNGTKIHGLIYHCIVLLLKNVNFLDEIIIKFAIFNK
jgi:hypothetical protein